MSSSTTPPSLVALFPRNTSEYPHESISNKKALLSQRRPRDAPNIWVPWKVSRVLANAPGYFSRNLQSAFVPIDTKNVRTKFEGRSFIRSWDNKGYSKNLGSPSIRPRSIFSQIFKGLLFGWTLWIYLPNLKFVALSVPEIIGGTVIGRLLSR